MSQIRRDDRLFGLAHRNLRRDMSNGFGETDRNHIAPSQTAPVTSTEAANDLATNPHVSSN